MPYETLSASALGMFSFGLAAAFLIVVGCIVLFMRFSKIDHGFLGLMFLSCLIFFLIGFSFLVAASVPGYYIKVAVAVVDAAVVSGGTLLALRLIAHRQRV